LDETKKPHWYCNHKKPFPAHPCLKVPNGGVKTAESAKVRQLKPSGCFVPPFVRHLKERFLKEGSGTKIKIAPKAQLKTPCRNKTKPKQVLFSTEPQDEVIKRSTVKKQHQYIPHGKGK
jgi:hypothetical protein